MKQLLREFFELCPEGRCPVEQLTESEKRDISSGGVYLVGVCQRANKENGNGRIYSKEILEREVEKYQKLISENRSSGELDHPEDPVINLKNVSHRVTKMWWSGDNVMCKIKVFDTPSGKILKELIKENVKLGISSRGLGSVSKVNGKTLVEDDFQLVCFDMVSEPSTPGAFMNPEASSYSVRESRSLNESNMMGDIDSLIKEIIE